MQHLMGVDGVIVDFVQEISQAVGDMIKPVSADESCHGNGNGNGESDESSPNPQFTDISLKANSEANTALNLSHGLSEQY